MSDLIIYEQDAFETTSSITEDEDGFLINKPSATGLRTQKWLTFDLLKEWLQDNFSELTVDGDIEQTSGVTNLNEQLIIRDSSSTDKGNIQLLRGSSDFGEGAYTGFKILNDSGVLQISAARNSISEAIMLRASDSKFALNPNNSGINVLVGTTTDDGTNKLQVAGSVRFDGDIEQTDGTTSLKKTLITGPGSPEDYVLEIRDSQSGDRRSGAMLLLNASATGSSTASGEANIKFVNSEVDSGYGYFLGINQNSPFGIGYGDAFTIGNTALSISKNNNVLIGTITDDGSNIFTVNGTCSNTNGAWNVISDRALKENIKEVSNALQKALDIAECVRQFNYIEATGIEQNQRTQFIAQMLREKGFEGHVTESDPMNEEVGAVLEWEYEDEEYTEEVPLTTTETKITTEIQYDDEGVPFIAEIETEVEVPVMKTETTYEIQKKKVIEEVTDEEGNVTEQEVETDEDIIVEVTKEVQATETVTKTRRVVVKEGRKQLGVEQNLTPYLFPAFKDLNDKVEAQAETIATLETTVEAQAKLIADLTSRMEALEKKSE